MTSRTKDLPVRTKPEDMETTDSPCVLLLDLTHSALAGIDLLSFTTTPKFKGIKNVPPGLHFVFCSTTSDLSVRHGAWFEVPKLSKSQPKPLFVKKWNAATETLDAETETTQMMRWRANLGSIWKESLSPYRQTAASQDSAEEEKQDWPALTSHITPALLSRILGNTPNHWSLTSASSAKEDLEAIPGLQDTEIQPEKELRFLPIDLKRPWREGATGRERTEAARDHSWYLRELIQSHCLSREPQHILGEMQLTFLMVLTLNNYSCLEQWKRILRLVLTSTSIIPDLPSLYTKFLSLLRLQLHTSTTSAEGGLFDLADESRSLLCHLLHKFKLGLHDLPGSEAKQDIMDELDEIEQFLREMHGWEFEHHSSLLKKGLVDLEDGERVEVEMDGRLGGWDEEDETGEYAPAVVELTAEQMAELGITSEDLRRLEKAKDEEFEVESEDEQDLEDMDERY